MTEKAEIKKFEERLVWLTTFSTHLAHYGDVDERNKRMLKHRRERAVEVANFAVQQLRLVPKK